MCGMWSGAEGQARGPPQTCWRCTHLTPLPASEVLHQQCGRRGAVRPIQQASPLHDPHTHKAAISPHGSQQSVPRSTQLSDPLKAHSLRPPHTLLGGTLRICAVRGASHRMKPVRVPSMPTRHPVVVQQVPAAGSRRAYNTLTNPHRSRPPHHNSPAPRPSRSTSPSTSPRPKGGCDDVMTAVMTGAC